MSYGNRGILTENNTYTYASEPVGRGGGAPNIFCGYMLSIYVAPNMLADNSFVPPPIFDAYATCKLYFMLTNRGVNQRGYQCTSKVPGVVTHHGWVEPACGAVTRVIYLLRSVGYIYTHFSRLPTCLPVTPSRAQTETLPGFGDTV